jgi:transcriptional regulator with XRE-family HTH domain
MARSVAETLNLLFSTVHPANRGPYTNAEVATATGLAESYVGYLRSGKRRNPTLRSLQVLAAHFGVTVSYLVGETNAPHADAPGDAVGSLERNGGPLPQRADVGELVARLVDLSADSVAALASVAERLGSLEHTGTAVTATTSGGAAR